MDTLIPLCGISIFVWFWIYVFLGDTKWFKSMERLIFKLINGDEEPDPNSPMSMMMRSSNQMAHNRFMQEEAQRQTKILQDIERKLKK